MDLHSLSTDNVELPQLFWDSLAQIPTIFAAPTRVTGVNNVIWRETATNSSAAERAGLGWLGLEIGMAKVTPQNTSLISREEIETRK